MDDAGKAKPGETPNVETGAGLLFDFFFYSVGRHDVRIFGVRSEYLAMAAVASFLFVLPTAAIIGFMPFWESLGELSPIKHLNAYIAPAIESIDYGFRAEALPRFPAKRFLIACVSLIELVLLINVATLMSPGVRRHALLVWVCYDRARLLKYFIVTCILFFGFWYLLFFDWTILGFLLSSSGYATGGSGRRPGTLILYMVVGMPLVTSLFGHIGVIVVFGAARTALRKLRHFRKFT